MSMTYDCSVFKKTNSCLENIYKADFAISIDFEKNVHILKNRSGERLIENINFNSLNYVTDIFIESLFSFYKKRKTRINLFDDSEKEKFKNELNQFLKEKLWTNKQ